MFSRLWIYRFIRAWFEVYFDEDATQDSYRLWDYVLVATKDPNLMANYTGRGYITSMNYEGANVFLTQSDNKSTYRWIFVPWDDLRMLASHYGIGDRVWVKLTNGPVTAWQNGRVHKFVDLPRYNTKHIIVLLDDGSQVSQWINEVKPRRRLGLWTFPT